MGDKQGVFMSVGKKIALGLAFVMALGGGLAGFMWMASGMFGPSNGTDHPTRVAGKAKPIESSAVDAMGNSNGSVSP
jgi:hypothetical protein